MRDCLFTGFVVATSGDQSGCFMGYVDTGCSANVSNCLSVGTYSYTATNSSVTRDRMSIDNSFVKQFPNAIPAAMQLTNEQLADGTIATALQAGREETVWVQDPVLHTPMLKIFANPEPGPATAIDEANADVKATKRIVNGQLLIERGNKTYTLTGQEVK